jgi:hypothetical protein
MSLKNIIDYISHGLSHVLYTDPGRIDVTLSQLDEKRNSMLEIIFGSQS